MYMYKLIMLMGKQKVKGYVNRKDKFEKTSCCLVNFLTIFLFKGKG